MSTQWKNGEFNPTSGAAAGTTAPAPASWPTPEARRGDIAWTERVPRPEPGSCPAYALESRQEEWDAAEAKRQRHVARVEEIRADREAKAKAERDAAEAAAEAKRAAQRAEREAELQRRFVAAGGTATEWEAEKAAIIAEDRRRAVSEGDADEARKRAAQAALYRGF